MTIPGEPVRGNRVTLVVNGTTQSVPESALLLSALSPGYALVQAMLPIGVRFYWVSLFMVHFEAWLFLAIASWRLPHCWQEKAGPARLRWRDRFRQWTYGPPAFREGLRRTIDWYYKTKDRAQVQTILKRMLTER